MGNNKNQKRHSDIDSSKDIATRTPNTSKKTDIWKPVTTLFLLMTISEDFVKMMDIMCRTHGPVQSIEQQFIVVRNRLKAIESEQIAIWYGFSGQNSLYKWYRK